jgi:hypothetical protein
MRRLSGGRQRDFFAVEEAGSFPGIGPADFAPRPRPLCHQPRAQQALEVAHDVELALPHLAHRPHETAGTFMPLENINLVDRTAGPH